MERAEFPVVTGSQAGMLFTPLTPITGLQTVSGGGHGGNTLREYNECLQRDTAPSTWGLEPNPRLLFVLCSSVDTLAGDRHHLSRGYGERGEGLGKEKGREYSFIPSLSIEFYFMILLGDQGLCSGKGVLRELASPGALILTATQPCSCRVAY